MMAQVLRMAPRGWARQVQRGQRGGQLEGQTRASAASVGIKMLFLR